jgi:hypothetical protein
LKGKNMATKVIDVTLADDLDALHCPVCGHAIVDAHEDEPQPCEHVCFLFCDIGEGFIYVAPACERAVAEATETYEVLAAWSDEETKMPVQDALDQLASSSVVCFAITTWAGVAGCESTLYVAVDFCPRA